MALGDIYAVGVYQTLNSQRIINVFYYRQFVPFDIIGTGTRAAALGVSFRNNVIPDWRNAAITQLVFDRIEVENLFDDTDVWTDLLSVTGNRTPPSGTTNEYLPTFMALGVTLDGSGKHVRNGKKRFAGLWEGDNVNGFTAAGVIAAYQPLITRLSQKRDYGGVTLADGFEPVIVQRVKEMVADQEKYRLPRTQAEAVFKVVTDAALSVILTTQNSRKIGKGV